MNLNLKKEIITHIFNKFGLLNKSSFGNSESPISKKFIYNKTIDFSSDGEDYKNSIWTTEAHIEDSRIQFIIADLTDLAPEYAFVLKLNDNPAYAGRISVDEDDYGSLHFQVGELWVDAPTVFQAKLLVAVEEIMELFLKWEKNESSEEIYQLLINYLKFESEEEDE